MTEEKNGREPMQTEEVPQDPRPADRAVVPARPQEMVTVETTLTEESVQIMEQQIELHFRLRKALVKATRPHDWISQGNGQFYLEGEGAGRIASVAGISWSAAEYKIEPLKDGHKVIICQRTFWANNKFWGDRILEEIGTSQTNDPIVGNKDPQMVNLGDVRKKASMNCISRGISLFTGLRGLQAADLAEFGINPDTAGAEVVYRKGSKGGSTATPQKQAADRKAGNEAVSEVDDMLGQLNKIINDAVQAGQNEEMFCRLVTHYKGKEYASKTEIEKYAQDCLARFGNCKALYAWLKVAKENLSSIKAAQS